MTGFRFMTLPERSVTVVSCTAQNISAALAMPPWVYVPIQFATWFAFWLSVDAVTV